MSLKLFLILQLIQFLVWICHSWGRMSEALEISESRKYAMNIGILMGFFTWGAYLLVRYW